MAMMNKKIDVTLKLPMLQNLIKRDPLAYKEEFLMQKRHFDSELEIFKLRPTKDSERFTELVTFICHVAGCYKEEIVEIPKQLMDIMETQANALHPDVRAKILQCLILLRNKDIIDPIILLRLAFRLITINDKSMRLALGEYIFNDIKGININKHNEKLNKSVQALLFHVVSEDTTVAARKTVQLLGELYRRRVWTDARTVNVLGIACLSQATRVMVSAIKFFLGIEVKMNEDDEEEKQLVNKSEVDYHSHSKKTKKRQRHVEKQVERNAKLRREQETKAKEAVPLFPAIQLLHDPQSLAEKLFKKLRQSKDRFEVKLLMMNFISRLIGCHKLVLLNFYSFVQRYLTSHQAEVTHVLAYLIQACHELVPPEELMPVIKAIAYNFITERCKNEVITVGINSVREILVRVPSILREPDMVDFIQDLAQYGKKTHKSVMIASHGIVNLVREMYPALLRKADRGKFHNLKSVPMEYGDVSVSQGVDGVELLEAYEKGDIYINSDDEVVWKGDQGDEGDFETEEEDGDDEEDDSEEGDWEYMDDDDKATGKADEQSGDNEEDEEEEEEEEEEEDEDGSDDDGSDDDDEWQDVEEDDEVAKPGKKVAFEDEDEWEEVASDASDASVDDDEVEQKSNKKRKAIAMSANKNRIDMKRVLTSDDFTLLNKLKVAAQQRSKDPKLRAAGITYFNPSSKDGDEEDGDDNSNGPGFSIDPESLASSIKTGKKSKIERISAVLEGRKEIRFEHEGHAGGLTNKEKERKKNYVMVRKGKKSVANKIRKSNSDVRYAKMKRKEVDKRDKRKRRRT